MKKIISFSLYGDDDKYFQGAINNCKVAKKIYPGWDLFFYVSTSVPVTVCDSLINYGANIVVAGTENNHSASLWRFQPFLDKKIDYVISRDADSLLSIREKLAVEKWIESGKSFHIMRDHPDHSALIMAGMCGGKGGVLPFFSDLVGPNQHTVVKGIDQEVLAKFYKILIRDCFVHASFHKYESFACPFPSRRIEFEFVGEVLDLELNLDANFLQRSKIQIYENNLYFKFKIFLRTLLIRSKIWLGFIT